MEKNPLKWPLSCITGILILILFFIFTPIAVALFPSFNFSRGPIQRFILGPYNIVYNNTSDLGNYIYNPVGAYIFNYGLIIIGILILPFFYGITKYWQENKYQILLKIARILGFAAGFALMLIGIFSENSSDLLHLLWTGVFFFSLLALMGILSFALLSDERYIKAISICFFASIVFFAICLATNLAPFFEWIMVLTIFGYIALLIYNIFKIEYLS